MVFPGMGFWEKLHAVALPVIVLVLVVLAHMMRMTRAAILNVMQSAYIETAELKGLSPDRHHLAPRLPQRHRAGRQRRDAEPGLSGRRRRRGRGGLRLSAHGPVSGRPCDQARPAGGAGLGLIFAAVYIGLNIMADVSASWPTRA
jgi:peptide/nickel transport system permease protein